MTSQTLPDGRVIRLDYDRNGNIVGVTPPERPMHRVAYTPADRPLQYTSGQASTVFGYNSERQLTSITTPDGTNIVFGHDGSGRLSTLTSGDKSISLTYDHASRVAKVSSDEDVIRYEYDGPLVSTIHIGGAVSGAISYTYDDDLRVTSQAVEGSSSITFGYDPDGLLLAAGALALTRDTQNGLLTATTLGVVQDRRTYNEFGELAVYEASTGDTSLLATSLTRDVIGRVVSAGGRGYEYDTAGRLVRVTDDGSVLAEYGYDQNSNRTVHRWPGGSVVATYDERDRLLAYGNATFTYTESGDLRTMKLAGSETSFTYDGLGNLQSVLLPGGRTISYLIDPKGRRVGKKIDGELVQGWLYSDELRIVAELDGAGIHVSRFVYGTRHNVPDYMIRGGVAYRLLTDHVGSPRLVVNASTGAVAQRIEYDAFGSVTVDTAPGFQPFGFAGGLYDRHTGFVRFGARDYDPQVGRFISQDPLGFSGGSANFYAYAFNDPINFVDPNGMVTLPLVGWVDAGEGAGAAALEQWADHITDPATTGLDLVGSVIGGALAALWTPCTSTKTFTTLSLAYGANAYVGRPFYQYYPANNAAYSSRYLTRGRGWQPPHTPGAEAAEKLSLPPWNSGTAVQKVPSRWDEFVGGPHGVTRNFGHEGGGVEYLSGGWPR